MAKAKPVKEEAVKEPVKEKVYKFTSESKFLSISFLGVQFINSYYETTNLSVARELAKVYGVSLIEE